MQYLGRKVVEKGWRKSWLWLIVCGRIFDWYDIMSSMYCMESQLYRGSRLFFGAPLVTSQVHKLSHVTSHRREC